MLLTGMRPSDYLLQLTRYLGSGEYIELVGHLDYTTYSLPWLDP
jgi:hypothetical protein